MGKKTYEIIPINKNVEEKLLIDNIIVYLYSRLNECQIETNINGNIYTILVSSISQKSKHIYIVLELVVHSDSCAVYINLSKVRPIFNLVFAVVAAPIALPASSLFMGSGILKLWNYNQFKKEIIKYIRTYVS